MGRPLQGAAAPDTGEWPFLYYASSGELAGLRRGPWKWVREGDQLFQLETDIGERQDRSAEDPQRVQELRTLALELDRALAEEVRPAAQVPTTWLDPAQPRNPDGSRFVLPASGRSPQ